MKKTNLLFAITVSTLTIFIMGCQIKNNSQTVTKNIPNSTTIQSTTVVETTTEEPTTKPVTSADDILQILKENISTIGKTKKYTEKTDENKLLGRPGQYVGKIDFWDARYTDSNSYCTIEYFSNSHDCQSRYEYLSQYTDSSLGAFGLNQYVYKYDKSIIRITYDMTPKQAKKYEKVLNKFLQ